MTRFFALAISLMLSAVACTPPPVDLTTGPRAYQYSDYRDVFFKWTRDEHVLPIDGGENVLAVRATLMSYDFRWAYVVRLAHDLRLSPEDRMELNEREFGALDTHYEFFVSVTSGVDSADRLVPDESPWRIRLEDDLGRQAAPLAIEEIERPDVPMSQYFHFDRNLRRAYRLRFPLNFADGTPVVKGSTRFVRLTFSSALGQADLRWDLIDKNGS